MSYIREKPSSLNDVCLAIEDLSWQSLETLALTIDSARRGSLASSSKKVSSYVIKEAVKHIMQHKPS